MPSFLDRSAALGKSDVVNSPSRRDLRILEPSSRVHRKVEHTESSSRHNSALWSDRDLRSTLCGYCVGQQESLNSNRGC